MRLALAALASIAVFLGRADAQSAKGFLFGGTEAQAPSGERIHLNGKATLPDLTAKLSPYTVKLSNECDGFCVQVSFGKRELLQVYLDEKKGAISGITSYDPGARDTLGHKIGDNLGRAIGAQPVRCDQGESTFCESNVVPGLFYVPSSSAQCEIRAVSRLKNRFHIPPCVKIEGFGLWRNR